MRRRRSFQTSAPPQSPRVADSNAARAKLFRVPDLRFHRIPSTPNRRPAPVDARRIFPLRFESSRAPDTQSTPPVARLPDARDALSPGALDFRCGQSQSARITYARAEHGAAMTIAKNNRSASPRLGDDGTRLSSLHFFGGLGVACSPRVGMGDGRRGPVKRYGHPVPRGGGIDGRRHLREFDARWAE